MGEQRPGELVSRASAGDRAAWDEIVERYTGLLWSVARSYDLSGTDADDVVQTAWLRLVERLGQLRDPDRVGSWLATVAHRESLRTLRRLGRERPDTPRVDIGGPHTTGPHHVAIRRERSRAVADAMLTIPRRCRRLLELLTMTPPLSYLEISVALGVPVGSIGPTRARCLARLRDRLDGDAR